MPDKFYAMQLADCDCGFTINGQTYDYSAAVDSNAFENPEKVHLTRASSRQNTMGLAYREGSKDPRRVTVVFQGLLQDHADLLEKCFENKTRLEPYIIERDTGRKIILKNAIVSEPPTQANIGGDGAEELNVQVVFETFNIKRG